MNGLKCLLAAASLALLALPASALGRSPAGFAPAAVPLISWVPPTPAEGARLTVGAGSRLTFSLAASAPGGPAVIRIHIGSQGLPAGATLQARDGNPASATFAWVPTGAQLGDHAVTFTAQGSVPGTSAPPRRVVIHVASAPPPKTKPKPRLPRMFSLSGVNHVYRWAIVTRAVTARRGPSRRAAPMMRLSRHTPEGTSNLVLLLDGRQNKDRKIWIRARLPMLPNNSAGWIPRGALGKFRIVRTRLVVNRARLTATLYKRGQPIFRAPVGIGLPAWPTPAGEFYIRNVLFGFNNPVYGPRAFGTSARSPTLTDWPGGGFVGIHGTNQPGILPGRVSHGCIRLKNPAILKLDRLMPVGTPLTIL